MLMECWEKEQRLAEYPRKNKHFMGLTLRTSLPVEKSDASALFTEEELGYD